MYKVFLLIYLLFFSIAYAEDINISCNVTVDIDGTDGKKSERDRLSISMSSESNANNLQLDIRGRFIDVHIFNTRDKFLINEYPDLFSNSRVSVLKYDEELIDLTNTSYPFGINVNNCSVMTRVWLNRISGQISVEQHETLLCADLKWFEGKKFFGTCESTSSQRARF